MLGKELIAYRLLHLRLLVACGILCWKVYLLAYHEFALCHARVALGKERTILYRRAANAVGCLNVEHVGLIVVNKRLQGEVVGCHLLKHIVHCIGKGYAIRA